MNILWDFDGTLFDTYPAYTKLLSQVLGEEVDKREIYQQLKISYSHAIKFYRLSDEEVAMIKEQQRHISPAEMKPFEGVEKVLQFATINVIMTHKGREGVLKILQYYGWEKYFVDIVTIDDGFPRKPHPGAYEYLHTRHGLHLAIGDRELDLLPAKQLGVATCMFQNQCDAADFHLEHYEEFFTKGIVGKVMKRSGI